MSVLYLFGGRNWTSRKSWSFLTGIPTHLFRICSDQEYRETVFVADSYKARIVVLERTLKLAYIGRHEAIQRMKRHQKHLERMARPRKHVRDVEQKVVRLTYEVAALQERIRELSMCIETHEIEIEKIRKEGLLETSAVTLNRALRLAQRSLAEAERARNFVIIPIERRIEEMERKNENPIPSIAPSIAITRDEALSVETTEYLEKIVQAVKNAVSSYTTGQNRLLVLAEPNIERSFKRFAEEIERATQQLQSSLDLEDEIEADLAQLRIKIDSLKADLRQRLEKKKIRDLEQNWDKFLKSNQKATTPENESDPQHALLISTEEASATLVEVVRVLRCRNILLHQRLFRIEVFAERLNQIHQMVELLPKSFKSELRECFRLACAILLFLREQRIQDDTRTEETEEFARHIDKLERSVQITFIRLIKEKRPEDKPSQKKRKQFEKRLHYLQKAKQEQKSEFEKWSTKSAEGEDGKRDFLSALAAQRCEKYQVLMKTTARNIDIIELMMHEKVEDSG